MKARWLHETVKHSKWSKIQFNAPVNPDSLLRYLICCMKYSDKKFHKHLACQIDPPEECQIDPPEEYQN